MEKDDNFPAFSERKTEPQTFKAMSYLAGLGLKIILNWNRPLKIMNELDVWSRI